MRAIALCLLLAACNRTKDGADTGITWDGKSTLHCPMPSEVGGRSALTLSDCKADLQEYGVDVRNCDLTLVRCDIKSADVGIYLMDSNLTLVDSTVRGGRFGIWAMSGGDKIQTHVVVQGGRVEAPETAIQLQMSSLKVEKNATLVGKVIRGDRSSMVTGIPELERDQANEGVAKKFGQAVCDMAVACYKKNSWVGKYTVDIESDGQVSSAKFDGSPPKDVKECLLDPKDKKLAGYDGPPGKLTCEWSVTHTSYSSDTYKNWSFVSR